MFNAGVSADMAKVESWHKNRRGVQYCARQTGSIVQFGFTGPRYEKGKVKPCPPGPRGPDFVLLERVFRESIVYR